MTDETTIDGSGAYGTRHVMEEQMRAAGQGVFANKMGAGGETKDVASMSKAELIVEAERCGVEIESSDTKAEIITKLQNAS
jgi:hypothetical protein